MYFRCDSPRTHKLVVEIHGVQPRLGEEPEGPEHAGEEPPVAPWLPLAINCHFNSFVVGCALQWLGLDGDEDGEGLAPPAPAHKPEVAELGQLVLHDGSAVPDLTAVVVIISTLDTHQGAVWNFLKNESKD